MWSAAEPLGLKCFILYFEQAETLSITGIRRLLLRFERAANKNQDQRSKYPDDPAKSVLLSPYFKQLFNLFEIDSLTQRRTWIAH
jgi:Catenin-beta-like, Arm-motif containing nuclear